MYRISIILPLYNKNKYLKRCLNSVINQSFKDFELIIIDDGSTDDVSNIYDEYIDKYHNIKVYKNKNGGVSSARNEGLKHAKGEYIVFVDSDDWLSENSLQIMYDNCLGNNSDLVCGSTTLVWPHININERFNGYFFDLNHKDKINEVIYSMLESVWGKLFKKEIIDTKRIKFDKDVKNGEDSIFLHDYIAQCNSISFIFDITYYYNKLEETTSVSKKYDDFYMWRIKEFFSRRNAYIKWSDDDSNKYINDRALYFLDEISMYYCDELKYDIEKYTNVINTFYESISEYITCEEGAMPLSNIDINTILELLKDKKMKEYYDIYFRKTKKNFVENTLNKIKHIIKRVMRFIKIKRMDIDVQ